MFSSTYTYERAEKELQGRNYQSRKLANNTYLHRNNNDSFAIKYHATDIIVLHKDYCELHTGGWYTYTTKERIASFSPANIGQRNNVWYMPDGSLFYDGIQVDYNGNIVSEVKQPEKLIKEKNKLDRQVRKYLDLVVEEVRKGINLSDLTGDCWYCMMHGTGEKKDQAMGDMFHDYSHLQSHMKEGYVVPSLILNAMKEAGYSNTGIAYHLGIKDNQTAGYSINEWAIEQAVRKYLKKRLLPRDIKTEEPVSDIVTAHTNWE